MKCDIFIAKNLSGIEFAWLHHFTQNKKVLILIKKDFKILSHNKKLTINTVFNVMILK